MKKHPTCIESTGNAELARGERSYVCGPDCPPNVSYTPGQAAYAVFRSTVYDMQRELPPLAEWDALKSVEQKGWEAIAKAAIAVEKDKHCEDHCICITCL